MAAAFLREQELKQAGPIQANPEQPVTTESQLPIDAETAQKTHWWAAMTENELWMAGEDVGRAIVELPRNLFSNLVGEIGDVAQLALSIPLDPRSFQTQPGFGGPLISDDVVKGMRTEQLELASRVPFTSEKIVEMLGGDPTSAGFQIAGFIPVPGAGSIDIGAELIGQAIAIGAFATRRKGGPLLKRLNDFLGQGGRDLPKFNEKLWNETGWYKGEDGNPRFYLSDSNSSVNSEFLLENPVLLQSTIDAEKLGVDVWTEFNVRLDEVLTHPELFDLYPELAGMRIRTYIKSQPDGTMIFHNRTKREGFYGGLMGSPTSISRMEMGNLRSLRAFHQTLLHESQHVVQNMEGWATGTSSALSGKMLDDFAKDVIFKRSVDLMDEGVANVDDLFDKLVAEGFSEGQAKLAVTNKNVQRYQQAVGSTDHAAQTYVLEYKMEIDINQHRSQSDLIHVLNFLYTEGLPEAGAPILEALGGTMRFEDMSELGFNAYLHSAGEAEARITGLVDSFTQAEIGQLPVAAIDPNNLEDVVQQLSVGRRRKVGDVVVEQSSRPFTGGADPVLQDIPPITVPNE